MNRRQLILAIIVVSQFCCTSLWFASNGVMTDLVSVFGLPDSALGHLTSAIQFGFICGTFLFALLTVPDRIRPSTVFLICAIAGAICNVLMILHGHNLASLLALRFLTGFCLAGIYPVGMKIAADHFKKGLGKSLGFLVGALVIGTALPHGLNSLPAALPWKSVVISTSLLAVLGGSLMFGMVPDGPYRKAAGAIRFAAFLQVFRHRNFRAAAFGYFGHMWELYAFWAFVPVMLSTYAAHHPEVNLNIPLLSFWIIGIGGVACVISGYWSLSGGPGRIALIALLLSGLCCLLSPLIFFIDSAVIVVAFLLFWGMVVIADSPLFSTLVAGYAAPEFKGTALTIVNCIGFSITIVSIQLLTMLTEQVDMRYIYVVLALGPVGGLLAQLNPKIPSAGS